jgi:hypothetical protein
MLADIIALARAWDTVMVGERIITKPRFQPSQFWKRALP